MSTPEMRENDSFEDLKIRSVDLFQRRQTLETEEAILMQEFKRVFAPAMIRVAPSVFVIIKPSRRQGIRVANYLDDSKKTIFFKNEADKLVELTRLKDYLVFDDRGPLTPEDTGSPFLAEVLKELNQGE